MTGKHLTDAEIQQFVLDKASCSQDIITHMHYCEYCIEKSKTYELLFAEIGQQQKPVFDFDLSAAVMEKISTEKSKFSLNGLPAYLIALYFFAATGFSSYLFRVKISYFFKTYILKIVSGVSSVVIILIAITFLTFMIFQCAEMYRKYRQKNNALNFY